MLNIARMVVDRIGDTTPRPALDELKRHLAIARRGAGNPSHYTVARKTDLSTSTISRILSAKTVPKWCNLEQLLLALGVPPDDVATAWHPRWAAAVEEDRPIDGPAAHQKPAPTGAALTQGCPTCGAVIADAALHSQWHDTLIGWAPPQWRRPDTDRSPSAATSVTTRRLRPRHESSPPA